MTSSFPVTSPFIWMDGPIVAGARLRGVENVLGSLLWIIGSDRPSSGSGFLNILIPPGGQKMAVIRPPNIS
jgi:hypothetical protein